MTLNRPDLTITLTEPSTCGRCRRVINAGEKVLPTRGLMRHNGPWLCSDHWDHA